MLFEKLTKAEQEELRRIFETSNETDFEAFVEANVKVSLKWEIV